MLEDNLAGLLSEKDVEAGQSLIPIYWKGFERLRDYFTLNCPEAVFINPGLY
jgi:hypothetical protein